MDHRAVRSRPHDGHFERGDGKAGEEVPPRAVHVRSGEDQVHGGAGSCVRREEGHRTPGYEDDEAAASGAGDAAVHRGESLHSVRLRRRHERPQDDTEHHQYRRSGKIRELRHRNGPVGPRVVHKTAPVR